MIDRRLVIVIDLDNDAFEDGNDGTAVARILRDYAFTCDLAYVPEYVVLHDENGNGVGTAEIERKFDRRDD